MRPLSKSAGTFLDFPDSHTPSKISLVDKFPFSLPSSSWLIRTLPSISSFRVQITKSHGSLIKESSTFSTRISSPTLHSRRRRPHKRLTSSSAKRENEEPESFLFEMWGVVISVAEQIPWDHPEQVRLVKFIRTLKDLPGQTTVQMDTWGELAIWSDLPLLGLAMTEHGPGMSISCFSILCFGV